MRLVETPTFTRRIAALLTDVEYWELQDALVDCPDAGALIPHGHGLRKLRWAIPGKGRGKRGGIRVIYYWQKGELLYLLAAYEKSKREQLTPAQMRQFVRAIEEE
ncbi:MAG: hypothetical protein ABSE73_02385 [Planctomycetota bacterium]